MALVRLIKVYAISQSTPSLLLEHRSLKEFLWVEEKCAVVLNGPDGNCFKQNSSKLCDAYGCLGAIHLTRGGESLGYFLALVTGCKRVGLVLESDIYRITDVSFVSIKNGTVESSSAASEMKRLLCSGSFYFVSSSADDSKNTVFITNSLQSSLNKEREEYLWNRNLIAYFSIQGIPCRTWLTSIMCGGVDVRTFYVGSQQGRVAVINRLNCERVGTRYNVRGADPLGNVANFVESEQVICIDEKYSSFIITRGSVPLFWEQPGLNVGSHKVKTPYDFQVSFQAYERHMENLLSNYSGCTLVNLLGSKEGEAYLSQCYQNQHTSSQYSLNNTDQAQGVSLINFDYHSECRAGKSSNISKLMDQLNPMLDKFGVNFASDQRGVQTGVLRVNCLDCLDRTNSVQTYIGLQMAARQLAILGHSDNQQLLTRVTEPLKGIWQFTGDLISRMYAGTGALEGKDAVGKLKDGAKSISRSIQNNFLDQGKQGTMDTLLGISFHKPDLHYLSQTMLTQQQFRRSSSVLLRDMYKRKHEFCEDFTMRVFIGTWNVNGGKFFRSIAYKEKTLKDWLLTDEEEASSKAYYRAVYDYNSAEDADLCLAMNDIIIVDHELEDGEWLHGFKGEQEGIFPAAYAQHIVNPHIAVYDFPAQEDGDLSLWTDEVVDVTGAHDDWLTGKVYRDGAVEEGTFPANFVKKMESSESSATPVDIYAIGFEEMVELNAGNIVNASAANQQAWASELHKTLSEQKYVLITSEQLVGVCLFLFVRAPLVPAIRELSVSTIKTGMGGATGNKGAVAISLSLYSTSFCFVCSHFAAGQTQVMERNNDYDEIFSKLTFSKNRPLASHDYIFWCGDFNYRIDLTGDEVKDLVKAKSWEKLRENDQLLVQKKMKNVFKGFNEGEINFAPTYKYDLFSDDYDTSEKCRVPAWTDRVLWKRNNWLAEDELEDNSVTIDHGALILYNRAEIKTSDHRPVVAMIDIPVTFTREDDREGLFEKLIDELQPIYSPVYVYVEGKPCDQSLCERFIDSLAIGDVYLKKSFPNACLVVYVEAWMAEKALECDGEFFEAKRIRLSKCDDNVVDEMLQVPSSLIKNQSVLRTSSFTEHKANTSTLRPNHFPPSLSSGNIAGLHHSSMKRQTSVPQLSSVSLDSSPTSGSPKIFKKPPPRPPAISNAPPPPRPPAINSIFKPGAPVSSSPEIEEQPDNPLDLNEIEADTESPQSDAQNGEFPDLSNWRIAVEPPKIKPRKTVPKRRAPVPPKHPLQHSQPILSSHLPSHSLHATLPSHSRSSTLPSKPAIPPPSIHGHVLDNTFGSTPLIPAPLSSPLVPARPSPVEKNKPDLSFLSSFDPLASPSNEPQRPTRTAPPAPKARTVGPPSISSDPFGAVLIPSPSNPPQDPWSSGAFTSAPQIGRINKSFTTNFNDFNS